MKGIKNKKLISLPHKSLSLWERAIKKKQTLKKD